MTTLSSMVELMQETLAYIESKVHSLSAISNDCVDKKKAIEGAMQNITSPDQRLHGAACKQEVFVVHLNAHGLMLHMATFMSKCVQMTKSWEGRDDSDVISDDEASRIKAIQDDLQTIKDKFDTTDLSTPRADAFLSSLSQK